MKKFVITFFAFYLSMIILNSAIVTYKFYDLPMYPEEIIVCEGLDEPIDELNNHTLREVFELNNVELITMVNINSIDLGYENGFRKWSNSIDTYNGLDKMFTFIDNNQYYLIATVKNYNNENYVISMYTRSNTFDYFYSSTFINANGEYTLSGEVIGNSLNTMFTIRTSNAQDKIFGVKDIYIINKTSLGIDNITVERMDYWFEVYKNSCKLVIDYPDTNYYNELGKYGINSIKTIFNSLVLIGQNPVVLFFTDTMPFMSSRILAMLSPIVEWLNVINDTMNDFFYSIPRKIDEIIDGLKFWEW